MMNAMPEAMNNYWSIESFLAFINVCDDIKTKPADVLDSSMCNNWDSTPVFIFVVGMHKDHERYHVESEPIDNAWNLRMKTGLDVSFGLWKRLKEVESRSYACGSCGARYSIPTPYCPSCGTDMKIEVKNIVGKSMRNLEEPYRKGCPMW